MELSGVVDQGVVKIKTVDVDVLQRDVAVSEDSSLVHLPGRDVVWTIVGVSVEE